MPSSGRYAESYLICRAVMMRYDAGARICASGACVSAQEPPPPFNVCLQLTESIAIAGLHLLHALHIPRIIQNARQSLRA